MDGLETPNESRETIHRNECRKGVVEEVAAAKVRLVSRSRKWFCYDAWRASANRCERRLANICDRVSSEDLIGDEDRKDAVTPPKDVRVKYYKCEASRVSVFEMEGLGG